MRSKSADSSDSNNRASDSSGRVITGSGEGRLTVLQGAKSGQPQPLATTDNYVLADFDLTSGDIQALGAKIKSSNPLERRQAFLKMLEGLTVDNALEMREQMKTLDTDSSEWRDFHYSWGAIAGSEAVLNGMESPERDMAVTLAGWANNDPSAAMAWFDSQDENTRMKSGELKYGIIAGLADKDPSTASNFVFQLAEAGHQDADRMLSYVASKLLRAGGPEDAAAWSENLPAGPLRASAMDRVANAFVNRDPVAAAAWAERFATEPHSARVIEEVGDEWAERDPMAAVNWLQTLDAGEGQAQGLSSAFGEWVRRDPRAASEHLVAMPQSPARDSAISGFVSRLAGEDPQSAITWAGQISDAGARNQTLVRAGQALFRRNADEARNWVATSGLPANMQEQVLNPPPSRRRR